MNKEYKLLYIEDQDPESIVCDLKEQGFNVSTDNNEDTNALIAKMKSDYDIYLLDFRLTENKGLLDAPSYASALRTNGKNQKNCPIVLITNEKNLDLFEKDYTSQDLFDFIILKSKFRENLAKYCNRMKSFVDAYKQIQDEKFNMSTILGISNGKTENSYLDYRLIEELNDNRVSGNSFTYCRTISNLLIRTVGALIGEDYLAARLGIDKKQNIGDWEVLKDKLANCKYKGILSSTYDRWWMADILEWWNELFNKKSLRRLTAKERVGLINDTFKLNLIAKQPLEFAESSCFWAICVATKEPLDPIDGYIYSTRNKNEWEEPEYISLYGALNKPEYREKLSPLDKKEIYDYGEKGKNE